MRKIITASAAALALAGATIATVTPADARSWHRGYSHGWHGRGHYYRGDRTGLAIGAGILGLAAGAAIASSGRPYYGDRYYDYGPSYYAPPPGYYGYAPPPCPTRWRWDGYVGRYVAVPYC